jgi:hypothetical protein
MKITTNNHWHEFRTVDEVPSEVLSDYEHLLYNDEMPYDGWIYYHKRWFHISDFIRLDSTPGWHGVHGDSYFSGTLIALSDCGDAYKIGYYTS